MLLSDSSFFLRLANAVSACRGSAPGRTKIKGVALVESSYERSMSKSGGLKYFSPYSSTTYSRTARTKVAGARALTRHSFAKVPQGLYSPSILKAGKSSFIGLLLSAIVLHYPALAAKLSTTAESDGEREAR